MQLLPDQVQAVLAANPTISGRIRAFAAAGCSRSEIAKLVGRSYQQVRNVLVNDERNTSNRSRPMTRPEPAPYGQLAEPEAKFADNPPHALAALLRIEVEVGGVLRLPDALAQALDVDKGGVILGQLDGDGCATLMSSRTALRQVQALVRSFVPSGVSLVDELLAERREEARREALDD